ncbi:ribulokinase [Dongia soli]|uniref:Ribulokinase n=1 Tax=Dongia soli TaxID=600628 RepID=A0ABU5E9M0_9PROT|nr:ribulokinase [Dongia soli]MDY0882607.1 ribulokinase [Dongia soli]
MAQTYIIGLDYGTESARGVLIDVETGTAVANHVHRYRHGVMTTALPNGGKLQADWALQHAPDYIEAGEALLTSLGRGRNISAIGLDFTASSPLPAKADGTPLSTLHPEEPHAYVKLWKHHAAQAWADRINAGSHDFLRRYGNRTSCEWLLAKAGEIADEAPAIWQEADRFIEAGDWLVWQLTGHEIRSKCQAGYKAHYQEVSAGDSFDGYPDNIVPGLADKLSPPEPIGRPAGGLSKRWRERTGIDGKAIIAVAVIDAHAVLPAVGATTAGTVVGALGTSACHLLLDDKLNYISGIDGAVFDGAVPGLWCYEAGQAAFGDMLAWFVRNFPQGSDEAASFAYYNQAAAILPLDAARPIALDWWNGCRTPISDPTLSGLLVGMTLRTSAVDIYNSLLESLCFGARQIIENFIAGGSAVDHVILTSGIAERNPLLMQMMSDILGQEVSVPNIAHATATGAAIHGAVAGGVVADFNAGARRFGSGSSKAYRPNTATTGVYEERYQLYRSLSSTSEITDAMHALSRYHALGK